MKKIAPARRNRKLSTVGAAGVTSHGDPGVRDSSPRGSNGRPWIDGNGVAWESFLTLLEEDGLWMVARIDVTTGLGLQDKTVLVVCNDLRDAATELAAWSHGLDLPYRDYKCGIGTTCDPAYGWPIL